MRSHVSELMRASGLCPPGPTLIHPNKRSQSAVPRATHAGCAPASTRLRPLAERVAATPSQVSHGRRGVRWMVPPGWLAQWTNPGRPMLRGGAIEGSAYPGSAENMKSSRDGVGRELCGGRYWVRTSDLFGVNEARYHCANRPRTATLADAGRPVTSGLSRARPARVGGCRRDCSPVCLPRPGLVMVTCAPRGACGRGSVGRASPCQGEGRGFESRRPLGEGLFS